MTTPLRRHVIAAAALLLLCSASIAAQTLPTGFLASDAFTGRSIPTAVRFSRDGRVFVAEQSGRLWVYADINTSTATQVADLRTAVHHFWDRGLLGLALHPDFPDEPWLYVLYTHDAGIGGTAPRWGTAGATNDGCPNPPGATAAGGGCVVSGRLSRLRLAGDVAVEEQVLLEDWYQQYPSHSIGSIAFGDDGALYASSGEGASFNFDDSGAQQNPAFPDADSPAQQGGALRAQDLEDSGDALGLSGTIVRIDRDSGAGLPGNPYFGVGGASANAQRIVAYGLRNPFRFTVRGSELWIGDVGWNAYEEIDVLPALPAVPGVPANFGWPCYEGFIPRSDYGTRPLCATVVSGLGLSPPRVPWLAHDHAGTGSAISGLAFYGGSGYPAAYAGALFTADYSRNRVYAFRDGDGNGQPDAPTVASCAGYPALTCVEFMSGGAEVRVVDLQTGPGGDLFYVNRDGGRVRRVHFGANRAPSAAVRLAAGNTLRGGPRTVTLEALASRDPEGAALVYAWDLDDDGAFDEAPLPGSGGARAELVVTSSGGHRASVRASDPSGASDAVSLRVYVDGDADFLFGHSFEN